MNFLAIGFYVRGGLMLVFGCFMILYVCFFLAMSFIPESSWNQPTSHPASTPANSTLAPQLAKSGAPPIAMFRVMAGIMGGVVVLVWSAGALTLYCGTCIKKRKYRILVYVMAALNCLFIPYGTLLGVFTFIVLGSPEAIAEWADPSL